MNYKIGFYISIALLTIAINLGFGFSYYSCKQYSNMKDEYVLFKQKTFSKIKELNDLNSLLYSEKYDVENKLKEFKHSIEILETNLNNEQNSRLELLKKYNVLQEKYISNLKLANDKNDNLEKQIKELKNQLPDFLKD